MTLNPAYVAGVFDGEGSIGMYRHHRGRFCLRTQFTQNNYRESVLLLKALKARYGGNFSPQRSKAGKTKFNWQLNAHLAKEFLQDILPFLILKRRQAELAIAWQEGRPIPSRTASGHFKRYPDDRRDARVALKLKALKY